MLHFKSLRCNLRTPWLGCWNGWGFFNVWELIKEVLALEKMSFAVIKASWRSKMRMEVLKKSGSRGKGEREVCFFFGYQGIVELCHFIGIKLVPNSGVRMLSS